MKKIILLILTAVVFQCTHAQSNIQVFYQVPFFGGYGAYVTTPAPPDGVVRIKNDLNTRRLTDAEIESIGSKLSMRVTINAACDNYDRIGNVNLALVPKDSTRYVPAQVTRIELGRYITPFMNKNKDPKYVNYDYNIDHVAQILKDSVLNAQYNFWVELEVFGVETSAQQQVTGCAGRKDVFYGSLEFFSEDSMDIANNSLLVPISMKKSFNNYQAAATDTVGKTIRTFNFRTDKKLSDAAFFLITSNHGANSGGEEYNRRNHFVYFNDTLKLTYKPGRTSCEPFRVYNTQANGIYGTTPRSDAQWQSFSNWCPGDVIDTRRIDLGSLDTGMHQFRIEVPDARFVNAQGNIPISLYLFGKTTGLIDFPVVVPGPVDPLPDQSLVYPNPASQFVHVRQTGNFSVCVYHTQGGLVFRKENLQNNYTMDVSGYSPGVYLIKVIQGNNQMTKRLVIRK